MRREHFPRNLAKAFMVSLLALIVHNVLWFLDITDEVGTGRLVELLSSNVSVPKNVRLSVIPRDRDEHGQETWLAYNLPELLLAATGLFFLAVTRKSRAAAIPNSATVQAPHPGASSLSAAAASKKMTLAEEWADTLNEGKRVVGLAADADGDSGEEGQRGADWGDSELDGKVDDNGVPIGSAGLPMLERPVYVGVAGRKMARPALPQSWANCQAPLPDSNEPFCMLNRHRELTLPRLTAAPTVTSSAHV